MEFRTVIVYDIWAVDMSYGSGTHPEHTSGVPRKTKDYHNFSDIKSKGIK